MSPKTIAFSSIAAFVIAVISLSTFGKGWLHDLDRHDSTVALLDLARQSVQQKEYDKAEEIYKQALSFARQSDKTGEDEAFVLVNYAEFVRNKRKNKVLAAQLDAEARKVKLEKAQLAGRTSEPSQLPDR